MGALVDQKRERKGSGRCLDHSGNMSPQVRLHMDPSAQCPVPSDRLCDDYWLTVSDGWNLDGMEETETPVEGRLTSHGGMCPMNDLTFGNRSR